jgi:hypothetical protein
MKSGRGMGEKEMTANETNEAFEKKYNYRVAEKCCMNCKHGEPEYEGEATCCHPEREVPVEGNPGEVYIDRHNCDLCHVCDAWERK